MNARGPRRKGSSAEREIVKLLREAGIPAKRVPLSGAAEGFRGDVKHCGGNHHCCYTTKDLDSCPDANTAEVKIRSTGFKQLYTWLGEDNDVLMVRSDRNEWLVVQRLTDWVK